MRNKSSTELSFYVFAIVIIFIILFANVKCNYDAGYHMEYSWRNGRWIWVDKDGRP